ncbi:MAG: hypothetical protein JXB36_01925 [Gammaproteobacteria bacterium]|nr:hypothetical protein [Gammaproteobacteria bacterium]
MSVDFIMDHEDERPKRGSLFDVVLVTIIVLTASFSAYTTYVGFSFDFPAMLAAFLCIVIGLALLAINLVIRNSRRRGLPLSGPLTAFGIVFVFSFISNTNAIYTFFIQRDIVGQTQEAAWRVFDAETNRVLAAIAAIPEVAAFADLQARLEVARQNLSRQIRDARNPGFGELAQRHFREVQDLLGLELTPLRAPATTASMPQQEAYARDLDAFIEEQAEIQFGNDPAAPILGFRDRINELRSFYEGKMINKEYDRDTTDLMARDLNSIAFRAGELLPDDLGVGEINNEADEVGSFRYTWRNFVNLISPMAIVLSVLLGALLDLLAPLLSVLLYRYEEEL